MLRGAGDSLTWKYKRFLGFLVSWSLTFGFLVSWCVVVGFLVSWFRGFLVSKKYQLYMSCFLEDIDLVSKIFKICSDGSSSLFGARLFENCQTFGFEKFWGLWAKQYVLKRFQRFSWFCLGVLVSPKIKVIGFGRKVPVQKSRNHENEEFEFLPKVISSNWSKVMRQSF